MTLTAAPARVQLAPDGYPTTPVWAFDGQVPGPVLRAQQGARMRLDVQNDLSQPTTVHWHGIRLENAMDGVPGLTQAPIAPGGRFAYDFRLPDAGTYWYHSHNRSFEQVARGLAGPLIVDEIAPPEVDFDEVVLLDDWRLVGEGEIAGEFGALFDASHGGRIGNWVSVNGVGGEWRKPLPRGARVRLRLINAANARIFDLGLQGMKAHQVALDGQPVAAPVAVTDLTLAPAQRVDLIADITGEEGQEALIATRERDGTFAIASFPIEPGQDVRATLPQALEPNAVPVPEPAALARVPARELLLDGGAMRGLTSAVLQGEELDGRSLAARGMVWSMNGIAGMPEAPFLDVARGEVVKIRMRNESPWSHGMHLHGHHFLVDETGSWDGAADLRDTTLVAPRGTVEIAFVADNPGDWLLHCHMLEHAHSGMMTWIRVT